jgi:hypothetical protein
MNILRRPSRSSRGPRDEIQGGECERVREHDPLLRAETDPEVCPDRGQGNTDRRYRGHRRAEDRGDKREAATSRLRERVAATQEALERLQPLYAKSLPRERRSRQWSPVVSQTRFRVHQESIATADIWTGCAS